jgi:hypothetical protein
MTELFPSLIMFDFLLFGPSVYYLNVCYLLLAVKFPDFPGFPA